MIFCEERSDAVDRGWSWVVLLATCHITGMTYGISYVGGFFYNTWLEEFHSDHDTIAWVCSIPMALLYLAAPSFPIMCRRLRSIKRTTLAFTVFLPLSFLLSSFANSIPLLFVTYSGMMGVGLISWCAIFILLVKFFDKYLSIAIATNTSAAYASTFYMAPVCNYLIRSYGWRTTFLILAGILVTTCIPCVLLYRDHASDDNYTKQPLSTNIFRSLLKSKRFWLTAASFGVLAVENLTFHTHMVEYAIENKFGSKSQIRSLPVYNAIGNIVGRFVITPFAGRVERKLFTYKVTLLMTAASALAGLLCHTFWHLVLFTVVYGFFEGGSKAMFAIIFVEIFGKERFPQAMTLIMLFQSFFMLAGPVIVGVTVDTTSSYRGMFYLLALVPFLSAVLLTPVKRVRREPTAPTEEDALL